MLSFTLSIWGGKSWAITLTWDSTHTTATLTKETGSEGELATWLSNATNVTEIEKASTLTLAKGLQFNKNDIIAINKLGGNIKHLDIDGHKGSADIPIDNPNFETIDFTDMDAYDKPSIAEKLVKCNERQMVAYPYPLQGNSNELFVECNAGTGNPGFIASQADFFQMVYGKPNISKVIVKGEINADDVKAINKATIDIIDLNSATIAAHDFDFSNNTSVKYIVCPSSWADNDNSINTKAFAGCTSLLAASSLSTKGNRALGYCFKKGYLKGVLNGNNYPNRLGNKYNTDYSSVKTAILAGNLNFDDISLCKHLTELNLSQANIASEDCYLTENKKENTRHGCVETLEKLTLPTDSSYTKIKDYAFNTIKHLKKVNISTNVKEIGKYAFQLCDSLPAFLDFVNTKIEQIDEGAFENCKQITYIRFPESLLSIGKYAFRYHNCETLRIPHNVEFIGEEAFRSGSGTAAGSSGENLKDVYFQSVEAPTVEQDAFGEAAYTGNNGYKSDDIYGEYATRENYINGDKWFAVLHFRPDLTPEQEKKYVDITRNYYYKDLYLGEQRRWPTQDEFNQSYGIERTEATVDPISKKPYQPGKYGALQGCHFDGTPLSEDEKTRIGLYQFVLTRNDAPIPDLQEPDKPDFPLNINDNDWWTICLPFSLDKEQVKTVFGDNTQLYTLGKVVRNPNTHKIHLYFDKDVMDGNKEGGETIYGKQLYEGYETTGIKAWYPYIIKPSKDFGGKTAVVENYRLEAGSEKDVVVKAEDEYSNIGDNKEKGVGWYYVFRGNCSGTKSKSGISTQNIIYRPANCYFMGLVGGKAAFLYQSNANKSKAFAPYTCAIMTYKYLGKATDAKIHHLIDDSFKEESTGAKYHEACSLVEFENTTTPINDVDIITPDKVVCGDIYNMNGQLVKKNATTLDGLPKGIYIINGKKYIVK